MVNTAVILCCETKLLEAKCMVIIWSQCYFPTLQPPLLTAPALSDLPQTARGTNFTDQLADSTTITMLPQETTVNRSISSSSGEIGMKLGMQRKDSFYESDDEIKTPRKSSPKKASPIKSSPKEHSPPCYDQALGSVDTRVSYEHVESHVKRLEYESVEPVSSDITQEHFESVRSVKTHEVMAPLSLEVMAPLPSYEEATLGVDMGVANAELFQFKDEDAPPVPPRTESHGAMDVAVDIVPESPDKHFELDSDQVHILSEPVIKTYKLTFQNFQLVYNSLPFGTQYYTVHGLWIICLICI